MSDFNYEKAWFVIAKPAFLNLNYQQRNAHSKLIPLIGELNQGRDLNIPLSPAIEAILNGLSCQEIAELSNTSYFVGHWKPGNTESLFSNSRGESWKISNVCDQVLRKRLTIPHNVQIHEGKFRKTFSGKDFWLWEEFGLATEKNLEIYNCFDHKFNRETLEHNVKDLAKECNDLWPDVEEVEDNLEYIEFLTHKTVLKTQAQIEKALKEIADAEKEIQNAEDHHAGLQWLFKNKISFDNLIYYKHTKEFCFGWRNPLTERERNLLEDKLQSFPYLVTYK